MAKAKRQPITTHHSRRTHASRSQGATVVQSPSSAPRNGGGAKSRKGKDMSLEQQSFVSQSREQLRSQGIEGKRSRSTKVRTLKLEPVAALIEAYKKGRARVKITQKSMAEIKLPNRVHVVIAEIGPGCTVYDI
jgi:hypothetical protein